MTITDEELKSCPFCGGEAALHENDYCEPPEWSVYCTEVECLASAASRVVRLEAIAAWNQRASVAEIERLREVVKKLCDEFEDATYDMTDGSQSKDRKRLITSARATLPEKQK